MIAPIVEVSPNAFVSKAEQYCSVGSVTFWALDRSGFPVGNWVLTAGMSSGWAAAIADPEITTLFAFPAGVDTLAEAKAWLRQTTLGDLTAGQRTTLQGVLDGKGVPRSDFTLATSLARVLKRVYGFLREQDYQSALNFSIGGEG